MTDQPSNLEYWAASFNRILKVEPISEFSNRTMPNYDEKHDSQRYLQRCQGRIARDVQQFVRNAQAINCDVDV